MKSTFLAIGIAILGLGATAMGAASSVLPVGDPQLATPFNLTVHENGANSVMTITEGTTLPFSPSVAIVSGPDGVPEYSTGGVFLQAGDIYWLNPPGVPPTISDMLRIYPTAAGTAYGDTFSVFSMTYPEGSQEDPSVTKPDSPWDVRGLPLNTNLVNFPSVAENGTYTSPGLGGAAGTYTFLSDTDAVPEPTGWSLGLACTLGMLFFLRSQGRLNTRWLRKTASG